MNPGVWQRGMRTETDGKAGRIWGVLAPVKTDSTLYRRWAGSTVGETRPVLVRFFGRANGLEDGVSRVYRRGKRYLVLESRPVTVTGKAVMTDAVLREE